MSLVAIVLGLFVAHSASGKSFDVEWGDVLDVPNGHYRLNHDLIQPDPSSVGPAIRITADHVVLDLNGYTIARTSHGFVENSAGVLVQGASRVQIMKGTITGFSYGIRMESVQDSQVKNCSLINNSRGVVLWSESRNNQVKNNEISGSSFGIMVGPQVSPTAGDGTSGNSIKQNTCFNHFYAIYVRGDENEIKGNDTSNNVGIGVNVWGNDNLVQQNLANNNAVGILIRHGSDNEVRGNTANNNLKTAPFAGVHGGTILGVPPAFNAGKPAFATGTLVIGNTALGNDGGSPSYIPLPSFPGIRVSLDLADNSLTTFYPSFLPVCENVWQQNVFNSDNDLGPGFGPGVGCIQ
jgi:parallel beta-helix repeat protein